MRIAILEWELFGIEPEPDTAAWFAISLKRAFGQPARSDQREIVHTE
jgi:hypothetical protein